MSQRNSSQASSAPPQATSGSDLDYLAQHNIAELINTLTKELFAEKPASPVDFLIESLLRKQAARDSRE